MKDMAKIRLFYSGTMALILPQLKDIANFVYTPLVKVNQAKFFFTFFWSQMKHMTIIDKQTEITNRVQIEHISLRTKLAISFNRGKINAIAPE